MARLITDDPAIKTTLDAIAKPDGDEWAVFGLVPKTTYKLKVDETGSGWDDMLEVLNEGKVQFGYWRQNVKGTSKFVLINWVGEGVEGMLKGASAGLAVDLNNFIKKSGNAVHLQVNARSEKDLVFETIRKKLETAGGANYDAGAKKQGISEGAGVASLQQMRAEHQRAQQEASKTRATADIYGAKQVIDKNETEAFWSSQRAEPATSKTPVKTATAVDEAERKRFWEEQKRLEEEEKARQAAERAAQQQSKVVNKAASSQFWTQNQAAPASQPAPARPAPVTTGGAASSLRAKFEQPPPSSAPPKTAAPKAAPKKWGAPSAPAPATSAAPPPKPSPAPPTPTSVPPPKPTPAPPTPVSAPPPKPSPAPPTPVSAPPPKPAPAPPPPAPVVVAPPAQEEYQEEAVPAQEEYQYQEEYQEEAAAAQEEYQYQEEAGYSQEYQYQEEAAAGYAEEYQEEAAAQEEYAQEEYAQEYAEEATATEEYAEEAAASNYITTVTALYDYAGEREEDLSFKAGDVIYVIEQDPSGWWRGDCNGATGYFPSNFVQ